MKEIGKTVISTVKVLKYLKMLHLVFSLKHGLGFAYLDFNFFKTLSIENGISGIKQTSAPPAMAACKAIQPALRPMTSKIKTLLCEFAVVTNLSTASVAT